MDGEGTSCARRLGSRVALVTVLAVLGWSAEARAEPTETTRVRKELHAYYAGEKAAALQFAVPGLVNVGAGAALLATDSSKVAKGAAVPMVAFGAIELGASLVLHFRTDALLAGLDRDLSRDAASYREAETTHLRRVRDQLAALMWTEIALASIGSGLAAVGGYAKSQTVEGVGIGLAVESATLFILDSLAAGRAKPYLTSLESFRVGRTSDAAGWAFSYGARF